MVSVCQPKFIPSNIIFHEIKLMAPEHYARVTLLSWALAFNCLAALTKNFSVSDLTGRHTPKRKILNNV